MLRQVDSRYESLLNLTQHYDRVTCMARDRLTGRRVVLKTGSLPAARQELRALMAIPPGVGPAVLDAVWTCEQRLVLVLEELQGGTLLEAAKEIPPHQLPELVRSICQCLGHLHRVGFIHTDLKPANIFLLNHGDGLSVRLLDFGFALSRIADPWDVEEGKGGTKPYLAPELIRGWGVDNQADQFSLGMTLKQLFPALQKDHIWAGILERLCEDIPARRYPNILVLRNELESLFGLPPSANRTPPFGVGPMRGREEELQCVLRQVRSRPGLQVLLQARRGVGLTRFMLEAVLAIAADNGPPARLVDVDCLQGETDSDRIAQFLEARSGAGEAVLCGLPDPSPGLRWLDDAAWQSLRRAILSSRWKRIALPAVDAGSLVEMVADSLGVGGDLAEQLACCLHERTDGNLHLAAEGFRRIVGSAGNENALSWELDRDRLGSALANWSPPPTEPTLGSVHAELVGPLKICARAGLSLPRTVARDLLSHFCQPEHFDDLLGHGYLEPEGSARVRFVTQSLWCEAAATPCEQARQIDDWLNEHLTPNPNHTEEAISACNRARRMGDRLRESQHLAKALTQAEAEHRWDRIRQLLAYPGPELGTWTLDGLLQQVQILKNILGAAWSTGRILLVAGEGLMPVDGTLGLPLLERAARENDPHAAVGALCLLLDRAIRHKERESYQHYMDHLEQLEKASRCVPPGLLDFYRAQHAMASGRVEEAETLATQSAKSLRGSGDRHEGLSLQLLAILRFSQDPQIAIEAMCSALAAPQDRERSAQMRSNLTIMYSQVGDLEAGARCADDGIRELWGQVSPARLGGMRIHRAWTWAELDRIDEAVQEARKLLNLAVVRETRHHLIAVRLLLGFCHLHRSSRRVAITETVRGWEEAERGSSSILKADSLRSLIDVLLDLEAWDDVREYGSAMQLCTASTDDAVLTTSIRARALPVQVEGKLGAAAELLESHQNIARGLSDRVASARYLHHLGVVRLAQANEGHGSPVAGEAAQLFREEIGILAEPGHGYYRGRALLALSLALDKAGDHQGASAALHQAVSLARRIKSLGLLAQALQARAWLTVRGKASPELEHQRH